MLGHTLADIKKKNCSLRFGLYKSHRKGFEGEDVVQDLYLDREAAKGQKKLHQFQQTHLCAAERGTYQNFCQHTSASTLFLLYLLYISNFNISIQNRHLDPRDATGSTAEHQSTTCARKSIIIVKEGHSFLSRAQRVTGAAGMDALSITERRPAATVISCTVQR